MTNLISSNFELWTKRYINLMLIFLTVLIICSKKYYNDLIKAETVSSNVVLFIVEGISAFLIIIIDINP